MSVRGLVKVPRLYGQEGFSSMERQRLLELSDVLVDKPHLDSQLLESVVLTGATTTLVAHKLGRRIRGWHIVDATAAATYYRDTTSTADLALFLPIVASATVTASIVVF